MYIRDIIKKKRNKERLTEEEIRFFIFGYFKDEILDSQAAALLTAMYIYGLNEKEMAYMINAMAETGEELEFYRISNKLTDIHSLGGISDKVILILLAVLDAIGLPSAKVIGRELGMEDRLISIPGYTLEQDIGNFKNNIANGNIEILKSIRNLAPIEDKLYKLRHQIACDNNVELVAMSIMSQKVALGFYNIFFEITYGKNAYVKTASDAKLLARHLKNIGSKLMRNVGCVVTPLNEPIGRNFGNILELKEVYDALSGDMSKDIEEVVYEFATNILLTSKVCMDRNKCRNLINNVLTKGGALESFLRLIQNRGGDITILQKDIVAKNIVPILSIEEGYIEEIDVNKIRMLAKFLDAIRTCTLDKLDIGAGIVFDKKIGDKVTNNGILGYIYTNNDTRIEEAVQMAREAFIITSKKIRKTPRIEFSI